MILSKKTFLVVLLLLIFTASCGSISEVFSKNGIGFIVHLETDSDEKDKKLKQTIKILENKINALKLSGNVEKVADKPMQIKVDVYGGFDLEKTKKFLFTSYQLEIKKVVSNPSPSPVSSYQTEEMAKSVLKPEQEVLPYTEENNFVIVEKMPIITGAEIRDANAVSRTGKDNDNQITFTLNPQGAEKFGDWTSKNINNYLAVVLDKDIKSIAYIKSMISDSGEISGSFTKEEAENIARSLKSGYIPGRLKILNESQIKK